MANPLGEPPRRYPTNVWREGPRMPGQVRRGWIGQWSSRPVRPPAAASYARHGASGTGSAVGWSISGVQVFAGPRYAVRNITRLFATTYLRHPFAKSLKRLGTAVCGGDRLAGVRGTSK